MEKVKKEIMEGRDWEVINRERGGWQGINDLKTWRFDKSGGVQILHKSHTFSDENVNQKGNSGEGRLTLVILGRTGEVAKHISNQIPSMIEWWLIFLKVPNSINQEFSNIRNKNWNFIIIESDWIIKKGILQLKN